MSSQRLIAKEAAVIDPHQISEREKNLVLEKNSKESTRPALNRGRDGLSAGKPSVCRLGMDDAKNVTTTRVIFH
jgi:hypothetical protein